LNSGLKSVVNVITASIARKVFLAGKLTPENRIFLIFRPLSAFGGQTINISLLLSPNELEGKTLITKDFRGYVKYSDH